MPYNTSTTVTVQPGVGMIALFPAMNYKPWYAIGEFVDNAIQSWRANKKEIRAAHGSTRLNIDIEFDSASNTITITDNAAGISVADIHRAFTPASPPADNTGLSQFGIGMKSAATWYAKHFSVKTTALGEPIGRSVTFDIPLIVEKNISQIPLREIPADPLDHGTTLILTELNRNIPKGRTLGKIREYLKSIYRCFITDPDIHLTVAGQELVYTEPELLHESRWDQPSSEPVRWRKNIDLDLPSGAHITGWAGLLSKGKAKQAGFALLYRGKVVKGAGGAANDADDGYKPYEVFGAPNSFESQRLIGELDVSDVPVTHTKDALLWEGDDEELLIKALAAQLDEEPLPLLKMARGYRTTERGRNAQQHLTRAVESISASLTTSLCPAPIPSPSKTTEAPSTASPIEQNISATQLIGSHADNDIILRVIDEPGMSDRWISLTRKDHFWVIEVNRSHPFMQSFTGAPSMDTEPILRLAITIAATQIRMIMSGAMEPRLIIPTVNEIIGSPISRKIES